MRSACRIIDMLQAAWPMAPAMPGRSSGHWRTPRGSGMLASLEQGRTTSKDFTSSRNADPAPA
jgi:hypothetical protein